LSRILSSRKKFAGWTSSASRCDGVQYEVR